MGNVLQVWVANEVASHSPSRLLSREMKAKQTCHPWHNELNAAVGNESALHTETSRLHVDVLDATWEPSCHFSFRRSVQLPKPYIVIEYHITALSRNVPLIVYGQFWAAPATRHSTTKQKWASLLPFHPFQGIPGEVMFTSRYISDANVAWLAFLPREVSKPPNTRLKPQLLPGNETCELSLGCLSTCVSFVSLSSHGAGCIKCMMCTIRQMIKLSTI